MFSEADRRAYELLIAHLSDSQQAEFAALGRFREGDYEIMAYSRIVNLIHDDGTVMCSTWGRVEGDLYPPVFDLALALMLRIRSGSLMRVSRTLFDWHGERGKLYARNQNERRLVHGTVILK